jgi:DUF1365 family protein
MHKRLVPKVHAFTYRVYYLAMPLPATKLPSWIQRFPADDLGYRDGRPPELWARSILAEHGLGEITPHLVLLTMPRVLGYVFNPVSFYLCMDDTRRIRAVISEVHNTFGEQHSYLCAHPDHRPITGEGWMEAEKQFHVSPFLERSGAYRFRFAMQNDALRIGIDYYNAEGTKQLVTTLTGTLLPLTRQSLAGAFWAHPLVTLRAMMRIHWQALRLVGKGIRYIPKPRQYTTTLTRSGELTKM